MRRLALILTILSVFAHRGFPAEGMWLPMLLEKYNIEDMQKKGFRLTAEDIYSVNQASMKDAVVRIGGCTGVVVSERGLVLTNHHCAYGSIQSHSSVDDDYLTNGFWAMSGEEELPNPGLTVTFLVRMEDVTHRVNAALNEGMSESERLNAIRAASAMIEVEAMEDTRYIASVNSFYYGSEFYLFVYDLFDDVRLVGAPPSTIGKFGGDLDNWMWPRHTGDFAFFRIYSDRDNLPSVYSNDNVPYKSPVFLPISTSGTKEGDFTMVFGFPGVTNQYLTSHAVRLLTEFTNPHSISLRDSRLEIMENEMKRSDFVRIQYASKFASVSNAWKRWRGENLGLARIDASGQKKKTEEAFVSWVEESPDRTGRYGHLMNAFDSIYLALEKYTLPRDYAREGLYAIEIIRFAGEFSRLREAYTSGRDEAEINTLIKNLRPAVDNFFKNYHRPIDQEIFASMLEMYRENIDPGFYPSFFRKVENEFDSDLNLFAGYIFSETVFADQKEITGVLDNFYESGATRLANDPVIGLLNDIRAVYDEYVEPAYNDLSGRLTELYRLYVEGKRLMDHERRFYPDANRTLRVTYGQVQGYQPRDAVYYDHFTTLSGKMEKNTTGDPEYEVPSRLKELYETKDYGPWAVDGEIRISFTASNHTSGGNSGSPVINGDGHLIGLNFDRVWEGTMSDIMFDPERCRNISVDINYVLFITDRFSGAGYLFDEMEIIR